MNSILAKVLPQEGGLQGTTAGAYNATIALLSLFTVVGVAFGVHAMFIGHEHAYGVTREVLWCKGISAHCQAVGISCNLHHYCRFSCHRI